MEVGARAEVRFSKWDGTPHWHVPGAVLGDDEHGTWLVTPPRTLVWRPGTQFRHRRAVLTCVPHPGEQRWWVATFYDATTPGRVAVYVDVATPPTWSTEPAGPTGPAQRVVHAVDLDLDVVQPLGGEPFVDDEDELVEHAAAMGYPAEVVSAARRSAAEVLASVRERRPPFDGPTAARWLAASHPAP